MFFNFPTIIVFEDDNIGNVEEGLCPNIPDDQNTICAPMYVTVSVSAQHNTSAEDRAVNMTG